MSFAMFVLRFQGGGTDSMPSHAFDVFRPHIDRTDPEFNFWHVRTTDDGEADIYAAVAPKTLDSLMISRFSPGAVLDLLAEFAQQAGAVILPPGCPTLLTAEEQRQELPDELRREAVVVRDGRGIEQVLRTCA
jgi:hypothetical protein